MELHRILRSLLYAFGVVTIAALLGLVLEVGRAVHDIDALIKADNGLRGTVQLVNSDLLSLGITLDAVQAASNQQAAYSKKLLASLDRANADLAKIGEATDQLKAMLANADIQVNGGLLPSLNQRVNEMGDTIAALTTDADVLRKTIDDADAQVSNPDIPATLKNLRETSANAASITAHTDATTADIQTAVHRWTKPAHSAWWFIKEALRPAVDAVELYHFL